MINLGTDVGGKWGDGNDIPTACMVARNRYVVTQGHMISQFWHAYRHCVHHGIRQIIGLDWWQSTGHYYPSREHIRNITAEIKARLQRDGVSKDMACFENDNEPAKYNVPPDVHSWQANEIQDVLGNDYDCYAGSEEVSYRNFYNSLNTIAKGYSFHLQNCALNKSATDASVNFMSSLAGNKGKLLTCSEGNFQDPSHLSTWHNVHYHVEACRRINALDYCVIFLELRDHYRYEWLSFKYNDRVRSPYYADYINMCISEKKKQKPKINIGGLGTMIIKTVGAGANDVKRGYSVGLLQELLIYHKYLPQGNVTNEWNEETNTALKVFQKDLSDKYPNVSIDGRAGRQTFRYLIEEIDTFDTQERFKFSLQIIMSPYNVQGDT